jgi:60 kDa SS-A/Ro ribonucleoprotein
MANFGSKAGSRKKKSTKVTPVTQATPGREKEMVKNNAGGVSFKASNWLVFNRFLHLGSVGSHYQDEVNLTKISTEAIVKCLKENYAHAVDMIVGVSTNGKAVRNDYAIFALAVATDTANFTPEQTRLAFDASQKVCRIGTHFFLFNQFVDQFRGWGSQRRKAINNWYQNLDNSTLSYQVVKYQGRNTIEGDSTSRWSHRDLLRKSHPGLSSDLVRNAIYDYVCHGWKIDKESNSKQMLKKNQTLLRKSADSRYIIGHESLREVKDGTEAAQIVSEYGLTHESLPSELRDNKEVWNTLLQTMPATAMIRTLGRLTSYGLLSPNSANASLVVSKLLDQDYMKKARIHPLSILVALQQYRQGKGEKGSMTWQPNGQIMSALEQAFNQSFDYIEGTGKTLLLAVDVSGSMTAPAAGNTNLNAAQVSALMAYSTLRAEGDKRVDTTAFDTSEKPFNLRSKMSLQDIMDLASRSIHGGTDCSVPIRKAIASRKRYDAIVIYSDGEAWVGGQVHELMNEYRKKVNPDAKLICVNSSSNRHQLTDPNDILSLEVVGFSTSTPAVITAFLND